MILDANLNQLHQLDPLEFLTRIPSDQAMLVYLDPPWGSRFLPNEQVYSPPDEDAPQIPRIVTYRGCPYFYARMGFHVGSTLTDGLGLTCCFEGA